MSGSYRRLNTEDSSSGSQPQSFGPAGRTRTKSERIADKLHALAWMVSAGFVARWSDFFRVILSDSRVARPALYAAVACLGINTVLLLYLTVYLHVVVGLPRDSSVYDVWCPRVIPAMTAFGILCFLLLIRATFPVWGFLSPFVLGMETLGALFALHFVPWL